MGERTSPSVDLSVSRPDDEPLWEAEFEKSDEWLVERQFPDEDDVWFEDGTMRIDCTGGGGVTVWARRGFPADVVIEYTATVHEEGTDGETSRNLNCFFRGREEPDQPLDETSRSGAYPEYHDWPNYIFTLTRTHTRLRSDPGFELQSDLVLGAQADETYTVRIAAVGDRIRAAVDGRPLHDWTDSDPHGGGWIGMRTYDTDVTYHDWTVYEVE